jgi:predicted nucleic acid-binding protein
VAASRWLIDTNVLLRISRRDDPLHAVVDGALARLIATGNTLYFTHQNMAEFWNVATRPIHRNGFGLSVTDAHREVEALERGLILLPDKEAVYREWRRLVVTHAVAGVQVHDARLVAAMHVHGVPQLLTLNTGDFARYSEITVVHPQTVVQETRQ